MANGASAHTAGRLQRTALLLMAVTVLVLWLTVEALTAGPQVDIVGTVVAPCADADTSTVDVSADGELIKSRELSPWMPINDHLCSASISVPDVGDYDMYTLDCGSLTATVRQTVIYGTMTIRFSAE